MPYDRPLPNGGERSPRNIHPPGADDYDNLTDSPHGELGSNRQEYIRPIPTAQQEPLEDDREQPEQTRPYARPYGNKPANRRYNRSRDDNTGYDELPAADSDVERLEKTRLRIWIAKFAVIFMGVILVAFIAVFLIVANQNKKMPDTAVIGAIFGNLSEILLTIVGK